MKDRKLKGRNSSAGPSVPILLIVWSKLIAVIFFLISLVRGIALLISQFFPKKKSVEIEESRMNEAADVSGDLPPNNNGGAAPAVSGGSSGTPPATDGKPDPTNQATSTDTVVKKVETKPGKKSVKKKTVVKSQIKKETTKVNKSTKPATKKAKVNKKNVKKNPIIEVENPIEEKIEVVKPNKLDGFGVGGRKKPLGRRGIRLKPMGGVDGPRL